MSYLVLLEEGVCYDQYVLLAKLLVFALLHSVLQGPICLLLQVFLDFLFLESSSNERQGKSKYVNKTTKENVAGGYETGEY